MDDSASGGVGDGGVDQSHHRLHFYYVPFCWMIVVRLKEFKQYREIGKKANKHKFSWIFLKLRNC